MCTHNVGYRNLSISLISQGTPISGDMYRVDSLRRGGTGMPLALFLKEFMGFGVLYLSLYM